jgi:ATP adenylyltransferase
VERLWAVWRMAYIDQATSVPKEELACIFCELPKQEDPDVSMIVERREAVFALLNIYPYNTGHTMVAPLRHVASLEDLSEEEILALGILVKDTLAALRHAYSPDGFNVGINLGTAAGAGFPGHVHVHVVPRWSGDTNFMPVLADTKVLPEDLKTTLRRVKEGFDAAVG